MGSIIGLGSSSLADLPDPVVTPCTTICGTDASCLAACNLCSIIYQPPLETSGLNYDNWLASLKGCTYGKSKCLTAEPEVPALTETIEDDDSVVDCCKKACSGVPAGDLRQQCENTCNMH
jgi:hypothetical protein